MRIAGYYSHLNGWEWLKVHHPELWDEIVAIIGGLEAETLRTKRSKEKTKIGQMLYSPEALNERLKELFRQAGWKESITNFYLTDSMELIRATVGLPPEEQKREIEATGKTPIFSYNQTDFVKNRVAVEVQFGKYAFIAYDLFVKHMAFFVGDMIDLGIEILATKAMQAQMSSGVGYYEHALYSIGRQGRGTPAVPLVLIGVEAELTPDLAEIEDQEGIVADTAVE